MLQLSILVIICLTQSALSISSVIKNSGIEKSGNTNDFERPNQLLKEINIFSSTHTSLFQSESFLPGFFSFGKNIPVDSHLDILFESVSYPCSNHTKEFIAQLEKKLEAETWALQMIDSWGKLPEGILSGHVAAMGDYDECVGIRWNDYQEQSLKGKYCTNYLIPNQNIKNELEKLQQPIWDILDTRRSSSKSGSPGEIITVLQQSLVTDYPLFPSLATCFPSSCSDKDINQILANALELKNLSDILISQTVHCETDEKVFTSADYAMIFVLAALGLIIIVGTAFDVYNVYTKGEKTNENAILLKVFVAFSVYTNTKKWWNTDSKSSDGLGCLHGIKFISTTWVVLGHTFFMYVNQPVWNTLELYKIHEGSALLLLILNAGVVVDTFFTVGGFLVSLNVLKTLEKTKGKLNIPLMYLSRYIRLTPAYALILGFCTTLIYHLSSGPNWWVISVLAGACKKNWWKNLLYINAVVKYHPENDPLDIPCHGEAWYLSVDMILFLISPFVIYPLWRKQRIGIFLMAMATLTSAFIPTFVTYTRNFKPVAIPFTDSEGGKFSRDVYMPPWMRGAPYAVGIWLGFILFKIPNHIKIPKGIVIGGWFCATGTALTVLFGIHHYYDPSYNIPRFEGAFYSGFHRFGWSVSISWLIFACSRGYGGYVNKFLCWKGFIPLGRLGYCVFLISLHVQLLFHLRYRQPIHYDFYSAVNLYFAHLITSYIVGFVCSITMEAPFMQLEKIIFGKSAPVKGSKANSFPTLA